MRGGALPLVAWGALIVVLLVLNWIWTGDAIQVGTFAYAALAVFFAGALLWLANREALRRGPPEPPRDPEAVPDASVGAVLVGLSVATIVFGLTFGRFLIYFGAGMLVLSLGRVALELRSERETHCWVTRGECGDSERTP
jgi:hypothetical protein